MLENFPLHRQARSKRQFIAQREKLATRMLTWTITQHIRPEHQAGGGAKREELCQHDSERQDDASSLRTTGNSRIIEFQATQLPRKIFGEKDIREFHGPAKNFKPQSEVKHELCHLEFDSVLAINVAFWSPFCERLLVDFILAYKG